MCDALLVATGAAWGKGTLFMTTHTDRRAEEAELVHAAQAGDLSAFERLYRDNVGKVYGLCLRMTADVPLAEELTQDVFIRAWQRLGSFRGESAFSSWLYPIAVRAVMSERRKNARKIGRVLLFDEPPEPEPPPSPGGAPEIDLERALGTLPPGARLVFLLHDSLGYSHDEIASLVGVAQGTSKSQLHRARRMLREVLR